MERLGLGPFAAIGVLPPTIDPPMHAAAMNAGVTLPVPAKRYAPRFIYRCPNCRRGFPRVRKIKRTVACLACCRAHNSGEFDARFRLKLLTS